MFACSGGAFWNFIIDLKVTSFNVINELENQWLSVTYRPKD